MATATLGEWVNARDGARIIGDVDSRFVKRLGEKGLITTRDLDGVRARFRRSDLERLAKSSVRPAPDPDPHPPA